MTHKKEHMIIFQNPLFPFSFEDQEVNPWFLLIGWFLQIYFIFLGSYHDNSPRKGSWYSSCFQQGLSREQLITSKKVEKTYHISIFSAGY